MPQYTLDKTTFAELKLVILLIWNQTWHLHKCQKYIMFTWHTCDRWGHSIYHAMLHRHYVLKTIKQVIIKLGYEWNISTSIFSFQSISCRKIADLIQPIYQLFHSNTTTIMLQQASSAALLMTSWPDALQQMADTQKIIKKNTDVSAVNGNIAISMFVCLSVRSHISKITFWTSQNYLYNCM